jgi:AsmA protein
MVILALPYIASNRIVRDRIALEMSAWSGYRVSIGAAPQLYIWPNFEAVLTDVRFTPWNVPGAAAIIESERVEVELSPLAALRRDVAFTTARLIRPVLRVDGWQAVPDLPAGRIARSVTTARSLVAENPAEPETASLPTDAFGVVEFVEGTIVAGGEEIVTGLTGKVDWPALNRPGFVTAEGFWRDEAVSLDMSSSNPLLLLGGGAAAISVTLQSAPASFRFDGNATLGDRPHIHGQGKFQAGSLRRLFEWSDAADPTSAAEGSVGLESTIAGSLERIRFENATLMLDDNPGHGVLDVAFDEGRPSVSGTLAFETLDLWSFLAAFTPLRPAAADGPGIIDTGSENPINVDLRLSASTATLHPLSLTDVAATAQVKERSAAFDISDATAFGGNVQAGIRFERAEGASEVEMRLLASEIDGGAFGAAAGLTRLLPIGSGNVSVILSGPGSAWLSIPQSAKGSVSASFGPGAISGLDLDAFLGRAAQGGFFAFDDVSEGNLPMEAAEFRALIGDGVVRLEKAELRSPRVRLRLSGVMPFEGGLALSGSVEPAGAESTLAAPQRFFIGGSWSAPFIYPIPSGR